MIPIKLSIQGLYSYQELQEINFQPLIGANVFGIFGKVGSGKTSLLEAISFALYGETERLNSRDNRQYNMMNLKSKHLKIDFEFQAGPEQQLYKFIYEAKRHPKKHHEITPGERRMFIRQENDWHPIGNEKEDVAILSKQILGLDYDNFKRTIIIPQNQFREFLELSPRDRTEMMNRLFKLDQYDLAGRVSKLSKANDEQLSELRGLLAPLTEVTPEAIEQLNLDIVAIVNALADNDETTGRLAPDEQRLLYAQKQSEALALARQELQQLLTQKDLYEQIRQNIAHYEICRLIFQADLANLAKLHDKKTILVGQEQKAKEGLNALTEQLPSIRSEYEAVKTAYENRDQIQQQINELDSVQTIRTLQESVLRQTKNRDDLTVLLNQKKIEIDQYKIESKKHQLVIDNQFGQESKLERLYKIQSWFTTYNLLRKQADDLQIQLDEYERTIEDIKHRKQDALAGFPPAWADLTLKTLPAQIEEALARLKTIREERESKHRQLLVQAELRNYTNALTDGTPCPLCGSEHHPARHLINDNGAEVTKSETALRKAEQRIDETTTLQLTIGKLAQELRGTLENGKRLIRERGEAIQQVTAHDDLFIWAEFSKEQPGDVSEAIKKESGYQQQLQDAQKAIRELNGLIEEAEIVYRDQERKITEVDTAIAGLNGQIRSEIESLKHYRLEEVESWSLSQIADQRESLTNLYDRVKLLFEEADKLKSSTETAKATAEEQLQQVSSQVADLTGEIHELQNTITQHLIEQQLTGQEVEQILKREIDVEAEKQRVKGYDDTLSGFQKQISDLSAQLIEMPYDPVELHSIQERIRALQTEKNELNKKHGRATTILKTLETQWQQKQDYQKRHDELDLRRQDLKKMDELFRAQGFVNYVSSVYLKNLCESANERFFKLTNNQLKLELDDKNNFQVRDYLNGGEVRSVKTLSGGQTFQAALSLALALSDNIQHLTKAKQNLFFLDEGFGTLDKDALQTVFKTLKALRSENRVVGIISHVEELQHEVDNYIRAEATENGSRITTSW